MMDDMDDSFQNYCMVCDCLIVAAPAPVKEVAVKKRPTGAIRVSIPQLHKRETFTDYLDQKPRWHNNNAHSQRRQDHKAYTASRRRRSPRCSCSQGKGPPSTRVATVPTTTSQIPV